MMRTPRVALLAPVLLVSLLSQQASAAPGFHAAWVDQSPWPVLRPGATISYTLHFRNTGTETWQRGVAGRQVNLGVAGDSTAPADAGIAVGWLNANRVATTVEASVAPNAIGTFTFTLRAPVTPGTYRLPLHPIVEGVQHLEDEGVFVLVVSDLGFHSTWVSQSPYPTLQPGQTSQPLSLVFRNTGTQTWTRGVLGQEARLGINLDDAQWAPLAVNWPFPTRVAAQTEASVAPGATATFTFQVRAPQTAGTYSLHLRPVVDGAWWMEDQGVFLTITVPGLPPATGNAPKLTTTVVQSTLSFPWDLAFAPDGRMFVTERAGNILVFAGGNHDGCRIRFAPDGKLWVTMGEVGNTAFAQNPNSLNGKVLRVNPDGTIPEDNPILAGAFGKTAAFTMGHRNPQGIAFQPGTGLPFTSEHAHYTDSATGAHSHATVNLLKPGLNFSWPNGAGPGFTKPVWQSLDNPYVATSGNTFVSGASWGAWDGDLFLAALAGTMLLRLEQQPDGTYKTAGILFNGTYGRLRAAVQGPDGSLYLTTDNGSDRIIRVTPSQ